MDTSTNNEANMRVINKEYERVTSNPDGIIMSDELKELMGATFSESQEANPATADSHMLRLIDKADPLRVVAMPGELSLLQFANDNVQLGFDIAQGGQELFQYLSEFQGGNSAILEVDGLGGFTAEECKINSWGLTRLAPHSYLLTISFGSENVLFR